MHTRRPAGSRVREHGAATQLKPQLGRRVMHPPARTRRLARIHWIAETLAAEEPTEAPQQLAHATSALTMEPGPLAAKMTRRPGDPKALRLETSAVHDLKHEPRGAYFGDLGPSQERSPRGERVGEDSDPEQFGCPKSADAQFLDGRSFASSLAAQVRHFMPFHREVLALRPVSPPSSSRDRRAYKISSSG